MMALPELLTDERAQDRASPLRLEVQALTLPT